jgi:hypothetical protein
MQGHTGFFMTEIADSLLVPIAAEVGPFRRISDIFQTPGGAWVGAVIASPLAIYLLKARERLISDHNLIKLAQMIGSDRIDPMRTCAVRELPKPIRQVLDPWGYEPNRDVIVLPRLAVSRVRWVIWAWRDARIRVVCGGDEFTFNRPGIFSGDKRFLLENSWILNTALSPSVLPIHGEFVGLPAGIPIRRRSLGRRMWYLLVALFSLAFYLFFHFGFLMFHH